MSPLASWALGMGDIQVNSSLNEALNAEIQLHSVAKKDLETLRIDLAPKSIYRRANIERSGYLSKFKFKVIERGGKHFISVTTRQPFREPYANFLIEATWSSGRLLREYTMLIDPPDFVKANARPVTTASTSAVPQVKRTPPAAKPVMSAPVQESKPEISMSQTAGQMEPMTGDDLTYGPTQKNDTLWTIAKSMAPAGVSIDQMMLALLRDNPEAFVNNNINNLKAGYVLRIKDRAALNSLDARSARQEVKQQYQTWKEARIQTVSSTNVVDRTDRTKEEAQTGGQLKILASGDTQDTSTEGSLGQQANQLKEKLALATEELQSKQVENQELRNRIKELEAILETKTSLVELKDESLAALQKQKEMAQMEAQQAITETEVVAETETQAATEAAMEQTGMVPPAEMTSESVTTESMMPSEMDKTEISAAAVEAMEEKTGSSVELTEAMEEISSSAAEVKETMAEHIDPSVALAEMENIKGAVSETEMMTESVAATPESEIQQQEAQQQEVQQTEVKTPESQKAETKTAAVKAESKPEKAAKPKPKPAPKPAPEEDLVSKLTGEYLPYTAGGGALLIALLAWLGLRGRDKKEDDFEESILDSELEKAETEIEPEPEPETSQAIDDDTSVTSSESETSFLSDFSAEDMESLQPDDTEADPLSEADVFMVYGRYQQAEELLKTAIQKEPERIDYQMKLLEVFHGDNQPDSFAVQADAVREALKQSNDDYELTSEWTKAKSWAEKLGVDIDMPDIDESGETLESETKEGSDELSLDDLSDELTLNNEQINLDEEVESLDLESEDKLSLDEELSSETELSLDENELTLDDLDTDVTEAAEESLEPVEDALELEESLTLDEHLDVEDASLEETSLELEESLDTDTLEDEQDLTLDELKAEESLELETGLEDTEKSLEMAEESLDLDLDEFDTETSEQTNELADLDLGTEESVEFDLEETSAELSETESLDLDMGEAADETLDLEEASLEVETEALDLQEMPLEEETEGLDLDISESTDDTLDIEESTTEAVEAETLDLDDSLASTSEDELDLLDEDMDLDDLDDDFPELDAVGTKLDLAKAYIDMGDNESATSILNEVIDEGSEEQKEQAKNLLSQVESD
jgi:pilus assembly protein FimV